MAEQAPKAQDFNLKEVREAYGFDDGAEYPILDYGEIAAAYYASQKERDEKEGTQL